MTILKNLSWFAQNEMESNPNKCHLLLRNTESVHFQISEKKLIGVSFDNKLRFKNKSTPSVKESTKN